MAIVRIGEGTEVISSTLNSNFEDLDTRLGQTNSTLSSVQSTLTTQIANSKSSILGGSNTYTGDNIVKGNTTFHSNGIVAFGNTPYVVNGNPAFVIRNTDITRGVSPSANEFGSLIYQDTNGAAIGQVYVRYYSDSADNGVYRNLKETCIGHLNASGNGATITIGVDANGNWRTSAPSCSNANAILTAVATHFASGGTFNDYTALGNGWIINAGVASLSSGYKRIQFPYSFTTTHYSIFAVPNANEHHSYEILVKRTNAAYADLYGDSGSAWSFNWLAIGH